MKTFTHLITESKDIDELPISKVAIFFTDIKGSSKLWGNNESKMYESLIKLEDVISERIKSNNGMVVKTIGDSFMASYENETGLLDGIKTAKEIQSSLKENPIKVGKDFIELRIGISYGETYIREIEVQNKSLKDYFGNTVGSSSRLESNVSEVGGFAFSILSEIEPDVEEEVLKYLENNKVDIEVIEFSKECNKDYFKRSARLLTDLQRNSCRNIDKLNGVKDLRAYKCKI